jgi:ketosteroid isomerase-like protein
MKATGEQLLEDHLETLSKGDLDAAIELYAEDAVLHYPGRNPLSGEYRGREEIRGFFEQVGARTEGRFHAEHAALLSGRDHAAALVQLNAEAGDRKHAWTAVDIVRVRDGKIAHHRIYEGDQYALDAWWGGTSPIATAAEAPKE